MTAVSGQRQGARIKLSSDTDQARAYIRVPQTRSYYELGLCMYLRGSGDGCSVVLDALVDKETRH